MTDQPSAIEAIAAERQRQVAVEGWSPEHDDYHGGGQLAQAAACYAMVTAQSPNDHRHGPFYPPQEWPWGADWWKPGFKRDVANRRRCLVKAGALIVAEIERLDRIAAPESRTIPEPMAGEAAKAER